jgi:hypothetical protein
MTALLRNGIALGLAVCIGACATQPASAPSAVVTPVRPKLVGPDRATDVVAIGRTTRADVIAALGETLVINFDNGYEVWVYRLADARTQETLAQRMFRSQKAERETTAEFVILFAPSGIVAKTRIRPAPQRS